MFPQTLGKFLGELEWGVARRGDVEASVPWTLVEPAISYSASTVFVETQEKQHKYKS